MALNPIGRTPDGQPLLDDGAGNQFVAVGNTIVPYSPEPAPASQVGTDPFEIMRARREPAVAAAPPPLNPNEYAIPKQEQQQSNPLVSQGMQETSKMQVQRGLKSTPEIDQALSSGSMLQEKGLKQALGAGKERAAAEFGFADERLKLQQDAERQQIEREARIQTSIQDNQSKLEASIADLDGKVIDPNRFYANAGTNSRLLAGISIALGAIGGAFTGNNENVGLKIITDAINRDMDAQKMEVDKAKSVYQARSSLFGHNMEAFRDERAAAAATQLQMLQTVEKKMQLVAAKTANQDLLANYNMQLGKLQEVKAAKMLEFQKAIQDKVVIDVDRKPQSAKEMFELTDSIEESVNKNPDLKEYLGTIRGLEEFDSFIKSGAIGAASVSFVANKLKQGSYGGEMERLVNQLPRGVKVEDWLLKEFGRGGDTTFVRQIRNGMLQEIASMKERLADKISLVESKAKMLGIKPTAFLPTGKSGRAPLSSLGHKEVK